MYCGLLLFSSSFSPFAYYLITTITIVINIAWVCCVAYLITQGTVRKIWNFILLKFGNKGSTTGDNRKSEGGASENFMPEESNDNIEMTVPNPILKSTTRNINDT